VYYNYVTYCYVILYLENHIKNEKQRVFFTRKVGAAMAGPLGPTLCPLFDTHFVRLSL
jgi:hypothetical protein